MARTIDLSITVRDGDGRLGLAVEFSTPYAFENVGWQGSTVSMFCHYATHVDAPNHFIRGGSGIDVAPLERLMGPAGVVELRDHGESAAVDGDTLEDRGRHLRCGDIAVLRTGWTDQCWGTPRFWHHGPYLAASGADWLVERGVTAVVYDFAEEYAVRKAGFRGEDCVVHHRILGADIYNIEYVHNLAAIETERCVILALPIKLHDLDGAPARVVALGEESLRTWIGVD